MKGYLTIVPMAPKKVDQTKREPEDEEGPAAKKPKIEQDSPAAGGKKRAAGEESPDEEAEQKASGTPAEGGKEDDAESDSDEAEKAVDSWEELSAKIERRADVPSCEDWFQKVKTEVNDGLKKYLQDSAKSGQISFQGALEEQEPLNIEEGGKLTTIKESWNWTHALKSLEEKLMYEAPGSIFWLNTTSPSWDGQPLAASELSYAQVKAGRMLWSKEAYRRSAEQEERRRYVVGVVIPTAIESMADFPTGDKKYFKHLPIMASRATVAGWYTTMQDALREPAFGGQVEKLYEAALSMPLRFRLGPSRLQVTLDSISFAESVYASYNCSCDSFWDFAVKLADLIGKDKLATMSQKGIVALCERYHLSFQGHPVKEMGARNLQAMCPFLGEAAVGAAIKSFEEVSQQLNDQTKLASLMHEASKTYQRGTTAAVGALADLIDYLKYSLVFKDILKDSQLTKDFLVGGTKKIGVAQTFFKRGAYTEVVKVLASSTQGPTGEEAKDKILPTLAKFSSFVKYAEQGQAAAGAGSAEKLSGDVSDEDSLEEMGVGNAAAKNIDTFAKGLSKSGRLLALLLAKTHGGSFDEDFERIAIAELAKGYQFPITDLFSTTKKEERIGGLPVDNLRDASVGWVQSTLSVASTVERTSAIGDQDHALRAATSKNNSVDTEADDISVQTVAKCNTLLGRWCCFKHIDGELTTGAMQKHVTRLKQEMRSRAFGTFHRPADGGGKKENTKVFSAERGGTMYLCSAELCPQHSSTQKGDSFRGLISGISEPFKDIVKFLCMKVQDSDVLIVSDGRSVCARRQIRTLLSTGVGDDFYSEIVVAYALETSLRNDVRHPKRKVALQAANYEVLFVVFPATTSKTSIHLVHRDLYANSGESTNFSTTYTGVPLRNLGEIPRLTAPAKARILGPEAIGAFKRERIQKEVEEHGHPLLWSEWKPVKLYSSLIREFNVADIFDFSPGSGAGCLAALYANVQYIGVPYNAEHEKWLNNIMESIFIALVVEDKVRADKELIAKVKNYLSRAVDAAKHMLPKDPSKIGDAFTGKDDSDNEMFPI